MNEPDALSIRRFSDDEGNFTIFIRLIDNSGYGVKSSVTIEFEHKVYQVNTDKTGVATFKIPKIIPVNYIGNLSAFTNGIKNYAKLKIENKKLINLKTYSLRWFFSTYNGRAILFIIIMLLAWIYCFIIGFGSSLIETLLHSSLSSDEILFNKSAQMVSPDLVIKPPILETWQHKYWLMAFLWSIFSLLYLFYAFIKALYLVMINWVENITDVSQVTIHKPLFDLAALWTGVFDRVTKNNQNTNIESDINFWSIVKANLLSEVFIVLGSKIFKKFFN